MAPIWVLLSAFFSVALYNVEGASILVVCPYPVQSHLNPIIPVIHGLATTGHQVTVLTGKSLPDNTPTNVTQLLITLEMLGSQSKERKEMGSQKVHPFLFFMGVMMTMSDPICKRLLENPTLEKLISSDLQFDMVILDAYLTECLLPLAHHYSAPLVLYTPSVPLPWNNEAIGNPNNYNLEEQFFLTKSPTPGKSLAFFDRMTAAVLGTIIHLYRDLVLVPRLESVARQYYPKGDKMPPLLDLERNTSLLLANTHFSLTGVRPNVPAFVDTAGIHCRDSKPLPKDLEQFVSSEEGFIFVSFGGTVTSDAISEEKRRKLIDVFRKLPERVLWKWDLDITDLPSNVKVSKWLPQQDILGHKRLKLFITQGGALSLQEAVYHGVPVLGVPIIADQDHNIGRVVHLGVALRVDLEEESAEDIYKKVMELITNPKYTANVKHLSELFRDQPENPLQRALNSIQTVLRHKGALILRSAAVDLQWYQYFLLDILGALTAVAVITSVTIWFILNYIRRLLRHTKHKIE